MTPKAETSTQIQTVLQADPALKVHLKSCTDASSAATLIVEAAANQGIALSIADVVACFMAAPLLQSAAISDGELDLVAGGGGVSELTMLLDEAVSRDRAHDKAKADALRIQFEAAQGEAGAIRLEGLKMMASIKNLPKFYG